MSSGLVNFFYGFSRRRFRRIGARIRQARTGGGSPASGDAATKRSATTARVPDSSASGTRIGAIRMVFGTARLGADATAMMEKSASVHSFPRIWLCLPTIYSIYHCLALAWINPTSATPCACHSRNRTACFGNRVAPMAIEVFLPQSNAAAIQANDLASPAERRG